MEITDETLLEILKQETERRGMIKAVAYRLHVSPAYLGDILGGSRPITKTIARKLGYVPNPRTWRCITK